MPSCHCMSCRIRKCDLSPDRSIIDKELAHKAGKVGLTTRIQLPLISALGSMLKHTTLVFRRSNTYMKPSETIASYAGQKLPRRNPSCFSEDSPSVRTSCSYDPSALSKVLVILSDRLIVGQIILLNWTVAHKLV